MNGVMTAKADCLQFVEILVEDMRIGEMVNVIGLPGMADLTDPLRSSHDAIPDMEPFLRLEVEVIIPPEDMPRLPSVPFVSAAWPIPFIFPLIFAPHYL